MEWTISGEDLFVRIDPGEEIHASLQNLADEIIKEFGEIDFSRPVSNNYWLNQLQNSLAFLDSVSFFDIDFDNGLDEIINEENRNYFISQLNQTILERISEL